MLCRCLAECSSCTLFPDGVKDEKHPEAQGVCTLLSDVYACMMPGAKENESKRRTVNGVTQPNSTGKTSGRSFVDKHGFTVANNVDVIWDVRY